MAKTVYSSELIQLQDGTEVKLVPLAIGRLRRFMEAWSKFGNLEEGDQYAPFDIYINCCGIALEKDFAEKFEETADDEKVITDEYRKFLEDTLDMETIFKIVEICGGINLNDPKLQEETERVLAGTS